jgi:16S rRNA (cytosine967-C5)-methyltransferase
MQETKTVCNENLVSGQPHFGRLAIVTMHRFKSYVATVQTIIENYAGQEPLAAYLKKFFSAGKKYGARDRKQITSLCFNFYRLGWAVPDRDIEEKITMATFLSETESDEWLQFFKPHWDALIHEPVIKKIAVAKLKIHIPDIFPFADELSGGINHAAFCESFLIQPDLFLRLRTNRNILLFERLNKSKLPYAVIKNECIAMPNRTKVEGLVDIDREVVVQDYSSQQVLNYLKDPKVLKPLEYLRHFDVARNGHVFNAWDCCAGSGGKSILLFDVLKRSVHLTVSDIRINILLNLHQRFRKAGIKRYDYFVSDLCGNELPINSPIYNIILCDVPCTGSGTWSRTPEQLCFFKKASIKSYSDKQKKIVANAIPFLQKDGLFVYITCSVFKQENEEVVKFIQKKSPLKLLHMELIKGYDKKADTMFVAVFKK